MEAIRWHDRPATRLGSRPQDPDRGAERPQVVPAVPATPVSASNETKDSIKRNIHYLLIDELGPDLEAEDDAALRYKIERKLQELIGYSMGQYALGYYTPPGSPGEAPDLVPPQYALGRRDLSDALGSPEDLEAIVAQSGNTEVAAALQK